MPWSEAFAPSSAIRRSCATACDGELFLAGCGVRDCPPRGEWARLEKISQFVGGSSASIYSKNAIAKTGQVYYDFGIEAPYRQLYFSKYVKFDPSMMAHFFADVGQTLATEDIMPYDEFLETRFYREWAQPQGLVDCANSVLDKSPTSTAMFAVMRHERNGVVDAETR